MTENVEPKLFTQIQLNDLVRNFCVTKAKAELLGFRLQYHQHLCVQVERSGLVLCADIPGFMDEFVIEYNKEQWRLFIDSFETNLKAVLLHNGNMYYSCW